MASNTTFGAVIVPTQTKTNQGGLLPVADSPALTPAVSRDGSQLSDYDNRPIPPHSPFYQHPPASHEVVAHSRSNSGKLDTTVFEKDVEHGNATPLSPSSEEHPFGKNVAIVDNKECEMWPSKQTLKQKYQQAKKQRREQRGGVFAPVANRWAKLNKKQKLWTKLAIALFLVGVAVAIGVGISVAVKGSYYVTDGSSKDIGQ